MSSTTVRWECLCGYSAKHNCTQNWQPAAEPTGEQIAEYTRILKQLPRQAAAELIAAITIDPGMQGRNTAIAQAAVLVSVGHRLGWTDEEPTR